MGESQNWRAKPERPALTPAFIIGFALWAACSAVYLYARDASIETCFKCGIIAGAVSILATSALACRQIPKMVAIIVLSISLGTTLAAFDAIHVKEAANEFEQMETIEATVVLEEDSSATESGERALARLWHPVEGEGIISLHRPNRAAGATGDGPRARGYVRLLWHCSGSSQG